MLYSLPSALADGLSSAKALPSSCIF